MNSVYNFRNIFNDNDQIQTEEESFMRKKKMKFLFLATVLSLLMVSASYAAPLDLTTFTAEDGVTVSGGGGNIY